MRRLLPIVLIALLVPAAAAESASAPPAPVSVPPLFGHLLAKARSHSGIAVRLPSRATFDVPGGTRLYATGGGSHGRYDLELWSGRHCGDACFVAAFTGVRARRLGDRSNVTLARGLHGHFRPLSCGASCSPPSISWLQHGVRYEMQLSLAAGAKRERSAVIALADSAITSPPR